MSNVVSRTFVRHWHSMRVDKDEAPVGFAEKVADLVRRLISVDVAIGETGDQGYYSWRFRQQINETDRMKLLEALRVRWPEPDHAGHPTWCWYGTETAVMVTDAVAMNEYVNGKE